MIQPSHRTTPTCPFCRDAISPAQWVRTCVVCGTRHHAECLGDHGGCAVFGCPSQQEDSVSDDWTIDPDDPVPIGEQISYRILYAIARGVYRPGDKLPTVREIATRLRVNPNTVSRSYRDLERDGILISRRGTGVFVHEDALETAVERRQSLVLQRFERAVGEALDAGLDAAQIEEVLIEALRRAARTRHDADPVVEAFTRDPRRRWTGKSKVKD